MKARKPLNMTEIILIGGLLLAIGGILIRRKGVVEGFELFFVIALTATVITRLFVLFLPKMGKKPAREELERRNFGDKH